MNGPHEINGIKVHPYANMFPMMSDPEADALRKDINENGLREKIWLYNDRILDGRNRWAALARTFNAIGPDEIDTYFEKFDGTDADALAFVFSKNLHRRHLTPEQQREVIKQRIISSPGMSDRSIAEEVKASPTTVGRVRSDLEATGQVSTVDTRTGRDGKQQPAHKPSLGTPGEEKAYSNLPAQKRRAKANLEGPPRVPREWNNARTVAWVVGRKFKSAQRADFVAGLRAYPEALAEIEAAIREARA